MTIWVIYIKDSKRKAKPFASIEGAAEWINNHIKPSEFIDFTVSIKGALKK
jgi:hypothetical protein